MSGSFVPGHTVPVAWRAQGNNALFTLNIKEHSLELSVLLHDVTGVKSQGVRARIAGPTDVSGRVVLDLDMDEAPITAAVGVQPGTRGVALWGLDATRGIQVPLIVEKLHFSGSTDKEMMWDSDMKCNSLAGSIVYPAL